MPTPLARSIRPFPIGLFALLSMAILWPTQLLAEPAAVQEAPSFLGDLLAVVLPLVFIVAALLVVLRIARKRFGITGQDAPLSVLQILPVGPRERIVLLRTRSDRVIAVGVCAQSVTFVAELDAEDVMPRHPDMVPMQETVPVETVPAETVPIETVSKGSAFDSSR